MTQLEFFFDYVSPFSYLANTQVQAIAARTGAEIVYRPFLLGGVMQATGNQPPATLPARGRYMPKDIGRWVRRYEIPFTFNPSFPMQTLGGHARRARAPRRRACSRLYHAALIASAGVGGERREAVARSSRVRTARESIGETRGARAPSALRAARRRRRPHRQRPDRSRPTTRRDGRRAGRSARRAFSHPSRSPRASCAARPAAQRLDFDSTCARGSRSSEFGLGCRA